MGGDGGGGDYRANKRRDGVPKGYLAIKIGERDEVPERIIIPVVYLKHPLFLQLLKEAEDEYGFDQKGTITIPCRVDQFRSVQGMIDKDRRHTHTHHHHRVACFRV